MKEGTKGRVTDSEPQEQSCQMHSQTYFWTSQIMTWSLAPENNNFISRLTLSSHSPHRTKIDMYQPSSLTTASSAIISSFFRYLYFASFFSRKKVSLSSHPMNFVCNLFFIQAVFQMKQDQHHQHDSRMKGMPMIIIIFIFFLFLFLSVGGSFARFLGNIISNRRELLFHLDSCLP